MCVPQGLSDSFSPLVLSVKNRTHSALFFSSFNLQEHRPTRRSLHHSGLSYTTNHIQEERVHELTHNNRPSHKDNHKVQGLLLNPTTTTTDRTTIDAGPMRTLQKVPLRRQGRMPPLPPHLLHGAPVILPPFFFIHAFRLKKYRTN